MAEKESFEAELRESSQILFHRNGCYKISRKEFQCLSKLSDGLGLKAIGRCLGISDRTVETHLTNIKNKLNVNDKAALISIYKGNFEQAIL